MLNVPLLLELFPTHLDGICFQDNETFWLECLFHVTHFKEFVKQYNSRLDT